MLNLLQSLQGMQIDLLLCMPGKEYAKADSRYATRDAFVVCMEAVTAFMEGPACWVIVYGILRQRSWRYVLQLTVSLGQLYGDILYFATTFYEGEITLS